MKGGEGFRNYLTKHCEVSPRMQDSIIIILLAFTIMAAYGYYVGFIRRDPLIGWLAQAGFVFSICVMIPFLIIVLWLQSGAKDRLARIGFVPHPSIEESVGISVGIGKRPIWVFETHASEKSIADFYSVEKNREGWSLTNNNPVMMIFKKDKMTMVIGVAKEWTSSSIIYKLSEDTP